MRSKMNERQFDLVIHGVREMIGKLAERAPEIVSNYQIKSSAKDTKEALIASDVFLQRIDDMEFKESIVNDIISHLSTEGIELIFNHIEDPVQNG